MLVAFIGMQMAGVSGNLMSLGAIDFGLVVDGAIILLENAVHHLAVEHARLGRSLSRDEKNNVVLQSALEVRGATAFGEIIIALVYVPILALQGVEGKMFHPMALTVLFALLGAFLLSLTFVPALASYFLSEAGVDKPSPVVAWARRFYEPALRATLARPRLTLLAALGVGAASGVCAMFLGSEFVPRLDEGAIIIEVNRLPSTSLEESLRYATIVEHTLNTFPEVSTVVTKVGRPEIANDLMGVEQSDVYVMLKPRAEWPPGSSHESLVEHMEEALRRAIPGASMGFSQPIEMRMNELISGVRSDFAVKVYGDDFATLGRIGANVARALRGVAGAVDIKMDRVQGLPVLRANISRAEAGRRGTQAGDILDAIETVGGRTVGTVFEGRRRFSLRVRLAPTYRNDVEAIRRLPVRASEHTFAQLGDVAQVEVVDEPVVINREATERRLIVQANVRGRDLGGFADAAQAAIAREVHMPPG
jgi:cobalt-zinc-cadmium resistance protein CzcA